MTKNIVLAGILNFFLLGAGYIYSGKRVVTGIFLTLGAILLTYLEQVMLESDSDEFKVTFVAVFLLAVGTTYDVVNEIKSEQS